MKEKAAQISVHSSLSLDYTIHDVKWVPSSVRFCVLAAHARGTGSINIFELESHTPTIDEDIDNNNGNKSSSLAMTLKQKGDHDNALKSCTFNASDKTEREFIAGDFNGQLISFDLENLTKPTRIIKNAHDEIINCIDGFSNQNSQLCITGSRDGSVKVWDFRTNLSEPVVNFSPSSSAAAEDAASISSSENINKTPSSSSSKPECWSVNIGNETNKNNPMILAGYSDGTVKMYDIRKKRTKWETNTGRGVCGVEFDRKSIEMNKFMVTCLESHSRVYDARTFNENRGGFSSSVITPAAQNGPTIWGVKHSPFNRELSMFLHGNGTLSMYKYAYPQRRVLKLESGDNNEELVGIAGQANLVAEKAVSTQPINAFDWNRDKEGLALCSSFDSRIRLLFITGTKTL